MIKMDYLKKLGKNLFITILFLLLLAFLITILYYFNLLSNNIYNIFKLIIPLLSFFLGGFLSGMQATKKGALEGLKIGGITLLLFLLLSTFLFQTSFELKTMLYAIILLLTSTVGGIIGINKKSS